MSSKVIQWMFPTPIGIYDLSEYVTEQINKELQNIGYADNNIVDGIRGNRDPSKIPELKHLYDKFQECINSFSDEIGLHRSYIYESWMNILSQNGSVGVHRHYNSIISGAYYPYVEHNSSPIVFINPLEGYRMLDAQNVIEKDDNVYGRNMYSLEAQTGKLILFPGWLQHYVPQNKSNIRITLSFNTRF